MEDRLVFNYEPRIFKYMTNKSHINPNSILTSSKIVNNIRSILRETFFLSKNHELCFVENILKAEYQQLNTMTKTGLFLN